MEEPTAEKYVMSTLQSVTFITQQVAFGAFVAHRTTQPRAPAHRRGRPQVDNFVPLHGPAPPAERSSQEVPPGAPRRDRRAATPASASAGPLTGRPCCPSRRDLGVLPGHAGRPPPAAAGAARKWAPAPQRAQRAGDRGTRADPRRDAHRSKTRPRAAPSRRSTSTRSRPAGPAGCAPLAARPQACSCAAAPCDDAGVRHWCTHTHTPLKAHLIPRALRRRPAGARPTRALSSTRTRRCSTRRACS
jgi:hypothetical protein